MNFDASFKRKRRSRAEIDSLLEACCSIIDSTERQISIRHLFYRLVGMHVIEKTESAYQGLCSHLANWRRSGSICYSAFVDGTRWWIRDPVCDTAQDALERCIATYRQNLWAEQPFYLEVWVEKDAIASQVSETAQKFRVPVFVARGFTSISSIHQAAQTFRAAEEKGKVSIILYLGDHDPSGVWIDRKVSESLRQDHFVYVPVRRLAILPEQIAQWSLPTRPAKKTDGRGKDWLGECVEIDVLEPERLETLLEHAITEHIDPDRWAAMREVEEAERETLRSIAL